MLQFFINLYEVLRSEKIIFAWNLDNNIAFKSCYNFYIFYIQLKVFKKLLSNIIILMIKP